uniref:Uncharacterized protein n=1 Tax=Globisporangium ultimum (strain ATCC 200006 / CBS 805.95 / DAOM BR144) TaxID=431595 RepID=K3W5T3_GLOUD
MCGLGSSQDHDHDHHLAFEKEKVKELLSHNDRTRSLSVATDTSIASILSNSDRLIPDAFMPVDIQVVSQRRVRPTSSRMMSQSGGGITTPSKGGSSQMSGHYYNSNSHANAAFQRYMTASTSASTSGSIPMSNINDRYYSAKRMNCADDTGADDDGTLSHSRRSANHSNLSARDLVRGYS